MTYRTRQNEIITQIAKRAELQPLLSSGLWFHHDIRDNFYYASYLFAAAVDFPEQLPFDAETAKLKAESVLLEVLLLQDQNADSGTYGHWPLNLGQIPQQAKPHVLPVELMGSLMAVFTSQYSKQFSEALVQAFESALTVIYRSGFYRKNNIFGHHDAKYTAAKLIFGQLNEDAELMEDGHNNLKLTLAHVRNNGMSEYSSLPWFWHWVQAFTSAWQLIKDPAIKEELSGLLDYLWNERAAFYLKGAWVGAHCRGQKHDIPLDSNVLFDYVQFGDFELPKEMPRTEYAGFLYYEAPQSARQTALNRSEPVEVKKVITKFSEEGTTRLHSYAYITADYAVGGMWERFAEFDNEQQRWDISFPLGQLEGVNQAYFYHPSEPGSQADPRHQTGHTDVLFHKNTIVALYPLPSDTGNQIIGILPSMEWRKEAGMLLGKAKDVYLTVYLMQPYVFEQETDRIIVTSEGSQNGIIIEATHVQDAQQRGLNSFEAFVAESKRNAPLWSNNEKLGVRYTSQDHSVLELCVDSHAVSHKSINGKSIDFSAYKL